MGELMAAIDWARTPLGPVEGWPASLRTSLDICLRSRFPILVWWGDDLVMLYNDAYRPMLGQSKHPRALGARGRDIWTEIWPIIGPMLDGVLKGRGATWSDNQLLLVNRNDYLEECYFTFSYSPIAGEDRKIGGVFTAVQETTEQVIGERRLTALRALGDEAGLTGTPTEACRRSAAILERHLRDVPFALIYLMDQDGTARLAGRAGIGADHPAAGDDFQIDDPAAPWPLANIVAAGEPTLVPLPATRGFPAGDWEGVAERAYLLPLPAPGRDGTAGVLVAGLSPRRAFDRPYADFLQLVAGHIATAVANATAYEAERARAEALAELDRAKTVFFSSSRLIAMLSAWRTFLSTKGAFGSKSLSPPMNHSPPRYTEIQSVAFEDEKRFKPFASASLCSSRGRSAICASPESRSARRVASSRAMRNSSSS
jgi:hypothetical protein